MGGRRQIAGLHILAPAKINLYLHILGRRGDGYHLLDSLIAFAAVHDRITVRSGEGLVLRTEGPFAAALGDGDDNLVLRAARLLLQGMESPPGADITLAKNLPVASGMGGGSSDAAAALKALNAFWALGRSDRELARLGASLGADIPVCLFARTAFVDGIGEDVASAPRLPPVALVLVHPGVALSTASVFGAREGAFSRPARLDDAAQDAGALAADLKARRNDLTDAACGLVPAINQVLAALDAEAGCLLARLSGSGATCFGLFEDAAAAEGTAERLAASHPGWWVQASRFLDRAPVPGPEV